MKITIGIDIGGSTTKIAGFAPNKQLMGTLQVEATDQITCMYGALGHFLQDYNLSLKDISKIVLTGVGASFIDKDIYGIPAYKVPEFEAIGKGGLEISHLKEALVVSMGTGTAFVRASEKEILHIGGSGMGGGTLIGLSTNLLKESNFFKISKLAEKGILSHVDLTIQDIYRGDIPSLPPDLTASNFGKIKNEASDSDLALGLINMIFQTIGVMANFACQKDSTKDIVLTGTMTTLPQTEKIFDNMSKLFGVNFIIPDNAVFATAIGAVVSYQSN